MITMQVFVYLFISLIVAVLESGRREGKKPKTNSRVCVSECSSGGSSRYLHTIQQKLMLTWLIIVKLTRMEKRFTAANRRTRRVPIR